MNTDYGDSIDFEKEEIIDVTEVKTRNGICKVYSVIPKGKKLDYKNVIIPAFERYANRINTLYPGYWEEIIHKREEQERLEQNTES